MKLSIVPSVKLFHFSEFHWVTLWITVYIELIWYQIEPKIRNLRQFKILVQVEGASSGHLWSTFMSLVILVPIFVILAMATIQDGWQYGWYHLQIENLPKLSGGQFFVWSLCLGWYSCMFVIFGNGCHPRRFTRWPTTCPSWRLNKTFGFHCK